MRAAVRECHRPRLPLELKRSALPRNRMVRLIKPQLRTGAIAMLYLLCALSGICAADVAPVVAPRSILELKPTAVIYVGKTADWVAIAPDAVWVASTGPFAVHRIDPRTNTVVTTVPLPAEPCAGIALGFGSVWIPLCASPASLAKVDSSSNQLTAVYGTGPAAEEGGIAISPDSVWLITDKHGALARIAPLTGITRQLIHVPAGSYNPVYLDGRIWVTRAEAAEVTAVDATSGSVVARVKTGPNPRFVTAGAGILWTLNQGDGSLSRIDAHTSLATGQIPLGIPGHGGDIALGAGMVWTTMPKVPLSAVDVKSLTVRCQWVGPGGDSLGISTDAIWLTDYHGGTISRFELQDALSGCKLPAAH
jgi:virginiamycin B lyase